MDTSNPASPNPVDGFSECHGGILAGLSAFATLPDLVQAAQRARKLAKSTLELVDHAVLEHHAQEEEDLFPAVQRSARAGAEKERVGALVRQLVEEHREIEGLWTRLRPQVVAAAMGKDTHLAEGAVQLMVQVYQEHARFEEREFLPLAQQVLGRDGNHMAALGLALHMRHVPLPVGYI